MSDLNFIDRMSLGLGEKLSYVFLISVIITCYEVVMRYVFNAPTTWVHDGATALSATGFLMAGCYCLQARRHIAITVIYDTVPQKVRNVLGLINAFLIVVFLGLLTWAAMKVAMPAVAWQAWDCRVQFCGLETSAHAWDVPIPAYLKSVLFLASVAMLVQSLIQFWQALVTLVGKGTP